MTMDFPIEAFDVLIPVSMLVVGLALIGYITKGSRNFRSSRNKRARKLF